MKNKTLSLQQMSIEERYRSMQRRNLELQKENALLRRRHEQLVIELDKLTAIFNKALAQADEGQV